MTTGEMMIYAAVYAATWECEAKRVCNGESNQTLEQVAEYAAGEATCAVEVFREIPAAAGSKSDQLMLAAMRKTTP